MFVGAGEMNESVATYFAAKQPRSLMVANRTLTRAANLCSKLGNGAQACKLEALPEILHRYDTLFLAQAANCP